jgi:hypothetical protein
LPYFSFFTFPFLSFHTFSLAADNLDQFLPFAPWALLVKVLPKNSAVANKAKPGSTPGRAAQACTVAPEKNRVCWCFFSDFTLESLVRAGHHRWHGS